MKSLTKEYQQSNENAKICWFVKENFKINSKIKIRIIFLKTNLK